MIVVDLIPLGDDISAEALNNELDKIYESIWSDTSLIVHNFPDKIIMTEAQSKKVPTYFTVEKSLNVFNLLYPDIEVISSDELTS
jgi:hypothetical protein